MVSLAAVSITSLHICQLFSGDHCELIKSWNLALCGFTALLWFLFGKRTNVWPSGLWVRRNKSICLWSRQKSTLSVSNHLILFTNCSLWVQLRHPSIILPDLYLTVWGDTHTPIWRQFRVSTDNCVWTVVGNHESQTKPTQTQREHGICPTRVRTEDSANHFRYHNCKFSDTGVRPVPKLFSSLTYSDVKGPVFHPFVLFHVDMLGHFQWFAATAEQLINLIDLSKYQ